MKKIIIDRNVTEFDVCKLNGACLSLNPAPAYDKGSLFYISDNIVEFNGHNYAIIFPGNKADYENADIEYMPIIVPLDWVNVYNTHTEDYISHELSELGKELKMINECLDQVNVLLDNVDEKCFDKKSCQTYKETLKALDHIKKHFTED